MIIKTLLRESNVYFRAWYEFVIEHVDGRKLAIHISANEFQAVVKFYHPNEPGFDWNFFYMGNQNWIMNICDEWNINPNEADWFVKPETLDNLDLMKQDVEGLRNQIAEFGPKTVTHQI